MSKKYNKQNNSLFLGKTLGGAFLILLVSVILYFMMQFICSLWIWDGTEVLYVPFQFLKRCAPFAVLFLMCGWIISSLILRQRENEQNIQLLIEATKNIYENDDRRITLPEDLFFVESQMNEIKMNVREKERQAKEAEQRKNDLVVYLAHDMKTPLTSVIGYLTLLCDEKEISPELRQKYLNIVLNKAEHLEDLMNEFFDVTRFNLTSIELELEQVNLSMMLEQMLFEFQPLFAPKNLIYKLDTEPEIKVYCDPQKMERVFENLFRNAIHYSYEGSQIEVSMVKKNAYVEIQVTNKGKSIPKEKLERLFEQFYRVDKSRSSAAGAGLGLAIAKQIVEKHGGKISAQSKNELVTFRIEMPYSE